TLAAQDRLTGAVPDAESLQVGDQVAVDFEELAVRGGPAEDLRELRVETRGGSGDQADGCGRCDGHQGRVAHSALDLLAHGVPVEAGLAVDLDLDATVGFGGGDAVERHHSLRPAGAFEVRVRAALLRQVGALVDGR